MTRKQKNSTFGKRAGENPGLGLVPRRRDSSFGRPIIWKHIEAK
jgi:hypothetical protein